MECGERSRWVGLSMWLFWVAGAQAQAEPFPTVQSPRAGEQMDTATEGPPPGVAATPVAPPEAVIAPSASQDPAPEEAPPPLVAVHPAPAPPPPSQETRRWRQDSLFGPMDAADHGGYGAFLIRTSSVKGETGLFIGGRGGWLIDHRWVLGGGGFGQVLSIEDPVGRRQDTYLEFGYGGGFVGYHVLPHRVVHAVFGAIVGAGGVTHSQRNGGGTALDLEADAVFVLEPSLDLEINLVDMVRFMAGLSYRWVADVDLPGTSRRDLSGLAFGAGFAFGLF